MNTIKIELPILPLRGITIFPNTLMHFDVKRDKSVLALEEAMNDNQEIFLVSQKEAHIEEPDMENDIYEYGTITKIRQLVKLPKNIVRVLVYGQKRGRITEIVAKEPYTKAEIEILEEEHAIVEDIKKTALIETAKDLVQVFASFNPKFSKDTLTKLGKIDEIGHLADAIAANLIYSSDNKQVLLSKLNPLDRFELAITILNAEIEIEKIKKDISSEVKRNIDQNQKEYYLREQIKVIQNELGDKRTNESEIEEYRNQLKAINAPEFVVERVEKELNRLLKIPNGSAEGTVIRNYVENLLEMPWNIKTKEATGIKKAEKILDEDHYGLEKVKERIIEHLAVRRLSKHVDSPIICLVGPPGTGKTSIAKSIARALNRNYSRISLGGVRDEAEIRGHRKTYIGAMPGRISNALKFAKSSNPLILLDEVDKMSNDFRGDPSSALLEVLDSEQNNKFRDHYVEVPIDLSDVLFIATANSVRNIPRPLLDRLELIEVPSYTENEKLHIAKQYLIPKQKEKHGLKVGNLKISDKAISKIINEYTKEAGVRNLERRIGEICRKVAKSIYSEKKETLRITDSNIKLYLGTKKYTYEMAARDPQIGIARGLAWTEVGGDTLSIEVNVMKGKGKFELTGQIGDVMKESAKAAISYIRSQTGNIENLDDNFYETQDIHIHIPEGGVPKDGPSAGITMATAMISALTNIPVDNCVAMTGEITLRGRVLPIGGLKEKLIAAKRAGITKVLVPEDNRRNVAEISTEITKGLNIIYVSDMGQVIEETLLKDHS